MNIKATSRRSALHRGHRPWSPVPKNYPCRLSHPTSSIGLLGAIWFDRSGGVFNGNAGRSGIPFHLVSVFAHADELEGNFHRDIRGAKIRFRGDGDADDPEAASFMDGFALRQTGKVGDMTAGRSPYDYGRAPYLEAYTDQNGRIVLELDPEQVEVIGQPIPACESDPISREEQAENMAGFLTGLACAMNVPAIAVGKGDPLISDPKFSHWVVELGKIVGEAHSVKPADHGMSFAFVRLFRMPEMAEHGYIATSQLRAKTNGAPV